MSKKIQFHVSNTCGVGLKPAYFKYTSDLIIDLNVAWEVVRDRLNVVDPEIVVKNRFIIMLVGGYTITLQQ